VLIVTHAGPLHAILRILLPDQYPELRMRFTPASITRLRIHDGGAQLLAVNQTAHLPVRPAAY
jgi:broad specificity phosphatase PhoE